MKVSFFPRAIKSTFQGKKKSMTNVYEKKIGKVYFILFLRLLWMAGQLYWLHKVFFRVRNIEPSVQFITCVNRYLKFQFKK